MQGRTATACLRPHEVTFKHVVVLSSLHHQILLDYVSIEKSLRSPRFVPRHRSQHKTRTSQILKVSCESNGGTTTYLPFLQGPGE